MTELKTLKDLKEKEIMCEDCDYEYGVHKKNFDYPDYVDYKKLKQEAIKWLKELHKYYTWSSVNKYLKPKFPEKIEDELGVCSDNIDCICGETAIIEFIKHFFNITEEDLK